MASKAAKNSGSKSGSKGGKAAKGTGSPSDKTVATNRRAKFDYEILDTFECGIVLLGPEVKALREGRANLGDAWAVVRRGEVWLEKLHISPYDPATRDNPEDPQRERKLLLHKREIDRLAGRVAERGLTLVPTRIYFHKGRAKVEIALARGKHRFDKRETIKRREQDLEAKRAIRRGRG